MRKRLPFLILLLSTLSTGCASYSPVESSESIIDAIGYSTQLTAPSTTVSSSTNCSTTKSWTSTSASSTTQTDVSTTTSCATLGESTTTSVTYRGALIRSAIKGTYYAPGSWNGYSGVGGSGRSLLDCSSGGDGYAKGSIASAYLYNLLGYSLNDRTSVWLNIAEYPTMNGIYYLDDCSGGDVIDFFYQENRNCPFENQGVVLVDVYYLNQ